MEILKIIFQTTIEANLILILGVFANGLAMGAGVGILVTWNFMKRQANTERSGRIRAKRPWDAT